MLPATKEGAKADKQAFQLSSLSNPPLSFVCSNGRKLEKAHKDKHRKKVFLAVEHTFAVAKVSRETGFSYKKVQQYATIASHSKQSNSLSVVKVYKRRRYLRITTAVQGKNTVRRASRQLLARFFC